MIIVRSTVIIIIGMTAAASVTAQRGTADLRYAATQPPRVSYESLDSIRDNTTSIVVRASFDVEFAALGGRTTVNAITRDISGTATTSTGAMPMPVPPPEALSVTFGLTPRGLDHADMREKWPESLSPQAAVGIPGSGQFATVLVNLPGRFLRVGETWTDTLRLSRDKHGMKVDEVTVTHGTYVADTTLAGWTLNVLRLTITQRLTIDLDQERDYQSDGDSQADVRMLWDSARHLPVRYDGTATHSSNFRGPDGNMQMTMTSRSIMRLISP